MPVYLYVCLSVWYGNDGTCPVLVMFSSVALVCIVDRRSHMCRLEWNACGGITVAVEFSRRRTSSSLFRVISPGLSRSILEATIVWTPAFYDYICVCWPTMRRVRSQCHHSIHVEDTASHQGARVFSRLSVPGYDPLAWRVNR